MRQTTPTGDKRERIAAALLAEIRAGRYAVGQRLPTRVALEARFQASTVTVQRALDLLARDGFVEAAGRRGTFVAEFAPHLARYGLVFPEGASEPGTSLFYQAILRSFQEVLPAGAGRTLAVFTKVGRVTNLPEYERLLADVLRHRLAGLVFAGPGHEFVNTPVLTHPGMPRITLASAAMIPGVITQLMDRRDWTRRVVQHLAQRRRRRVALFLATRGAALDPESAMLRRRLAAAGMETRDEWILPAPLGAGFLARNTALLLLRQPRPARPDAIIILDDNVVADITAGIARAGLPTDQLPVVVGHCNYPCPPPHAVPMTLLGFDFRHFARQAVAAIDACRAGQPAPITLPSLPAVEFADTID